MKATKTIVIFLGPPGAGKGTQAQWLVENYKWNVISPGTILRQEMLKKSELGKLVEQKMSTGQLIEDRIIIKLVLDYLDNLDGVCILDGFPRTITQALSLIEHQVKVDKVICFNLPDNIIVERLSGRRIHLASGRTYHVVYNPPLHPDIDDISGEPLTIRKDDEEEIVRQRLQDYHKENVAILSWCHEYNIPIIAIDATLSVLAIQNHLKSIFHLI